MTTEQRLEKLEKELARGRRFNRWLLAALGLSVGAWVATAAFGPGTATAQTARTSFHEVHGKRFVLEDEKGKPRAMLRVDKGWAGLSLLDENGKTRAILGVPKDGPGLCLLAENGTNRASLDVFNDGSVLNLCDGNGKSRAVIVARNDGSWLGLYDENGKTTWRTP